MGSLTSESWNFMLDWAANHWRGQRGGLPQLEGLQGKKEREFVRVSNAIGEFEIVPNRP